jgi:hypothetical protein
VKTKSGSLKKEINALLRLMDFVSTHPVLRGESKQAEQFARTYQQLGKLWEFLALQCDHKAGWRKTKQGHHVCRICGTVKGTAERWILLPRTGTKKIGRKLSPNSKNTFRNKREARIVEDTIEFHGAKVHVDVHNSHRSRFFCASKIDIAVAAERVARLEEDGIECSVDRHFASLKLRKHKRGERPPYGAFVWELPKRRLQKFPLMLEYDNRGELVQVAVLRPLRSDENRQGRKQRRSAKAQMRPQ